MSNMGGKREGAGRKPDAEVQKLRADLASMLPSALKAAQAIIDDPTHNHHATMTRWAIDKIAATPKPQTPPVEFELEGDTPADHARSIVAATSRGEISPSVSAELLAAVSSTMKIIEVSELADRIAALEAGNGNS